MTIGGDDEVYVASGDQVGPDEGGDHPAPLGVERVGDSGLDVGRRCVQCRPRSRPRGGHAAVVVVRLGATATAAGGGDSVRRLG